MRVQFIIWWFWFGFWFWFSYNNFFNFFILIFFFIYIFFNNSFLFWFNFRFNFWFNYFSPGGMSPLCGWSFCGGSGFAFWLINLSYSSVSFLSFSFFNALALFDIWPNSILRSLAFSPAFARLSNCSCVNCFLTFGAGCGGSSGSPIGSSVSCFYYKT